MPKEVCSPVSMKGSKVGSGQPMSPGARSNPSARRGDSVPEPTHQTASPVRSHSSKEPEGGEAKVVGPKE
jgi:hypothetical protein